jgi:dihydropteroate synthase
MGIVNVTPDSFSDGIVATEAAVAHALSLVADGADLLDIGGESTRPGAETVSLEVELARVTPVVAELVKHSSVPLSIDTSKAAVARACLDLGASIINDVTALAGDPAMSDVIRKARAGAVLMHMQGTPATMQANPTYGDVVTEIGQYFETRVQELTATGIAREQLVLDPGIGFGKTVEHNLDIVARLDELQRLGRPVCLGASRKGFIGKVLGRAVEERLAGSLAVVCQAVTRGTAQIVRAHDVRATCDVVEMIAAIAGRRPT